MTREEAIMVLNMVEAHGSLAIEAKDMAIKALEQQPSDDCVSRKAMLDAITEIDDNINMDIYTNEVREIIENLPPVTPTQKWIPVSERLPEENTAVLIWCPERRNIYCAYFEEKQWWIFGAYFQKVPLEVVAWMPLPKPYKAEMESEE